MQILVIAMLLLAWLAPAGALAGSVTHDGIVIVDHPDGLEGKARQVAAIYAEQRANIIRYFQRDIPAPVRVVLCRDTEEFFAALGAPGRSDVAAIVRPATREILIHLRHADGGLGAELPSVISHEIAHLMYWEYGMEAARRGGDPSGPLWLNEGIASWFSGFDVEFTGTPLLDAATEDRLLPFASLTERFPGTTREFQLAYAQSADFAGYIQKRGSGNTLVRLLQEYAATGDFDAAFTAIVGVPMAVAERQWKMQLPRSAFPCIRWLQDPYLYGAMTLLVIAGYWRYTVKRRRTRERWRAEEEASRLDRERRRAQWFDTPVPPPQS